MARQQALFDLPRAPRRVLLKVTDAGCGEDLPVHVHLTCLRCGHDAGWAQFGTATEAKRQPCPVCNQSH